MAYDELLTDRIRRVLAEKKANVEERKMFGGMCFMVNDKMCAGVVKDTLMARIGEDAYPKAITKPGCNEMDFTGRPMKGYVFVDSEGVDLDSDLEYWLQLCLDFNPLAKASNKRKKKI